MKQKRCVELHIPHYNPQKNTLNYWHMITHGASESVYCTTKCGAVNGLSCLTKLTTSKGVGTADSI